MTPTAQDIEQWKKEAEAEYPHDEKDGYLYNDFQDSSREGFVAGRQKSFEEYWKRIEMMEKIALNESRLVQLEIELRNRVAVLEGLLRDVVSEVNSHSDRSVTETTYFEIKQALSGTEEKHS